MAACSNMEFLTIPEAAKVLRRTEDAVRRAVRRGTLAARRLGDHGPLLIAAADLEAALKPAVGGDVADQPRS